MKRFDIIVVGGGPAGISAAISAKRNGSSVLICEKMPRLGKKLLISGSGRCNLLNERLDESSYNSAARSVVRETFKRFGRDSIERFFSGLGLMLYSQDGRIFPVTNQAASVLKALELELERLSIPVELDFDVAHIAPRKGAFTVASKRGPAIECSKLVLAGGGKTYPSLGSDGGACKLASSLGHSVIEPVPSAVPLVVKDELCHLLQGQRISAGAKALVNGVAACESEGELLFTRYGLSGTAILDISRDISIAINRQGSRDAAALIDMAPFMGMGELEGELKRRLERKAPRSELLTGILPNKFGPALRKTLEKSSCAEMARAIKEARFKVSATRGWNEAEFTSGGVKTDEVKYETLESKITKGLYFAGEMLDVDGKRGGYNLAWAWASGLTAGLAL